MQMIAEVVAAADDLVAGTRDALTGWERTGDLGAFWGPVEQFIGRLDAVADEMRADPDAVDAEMVAVALHDLSGLVARIGTLVKSVRVCPEGAPERMARVADTTDAMEARVTQWRADPDA